MFGMLIDYKEISELVGVIKDLHGFDFRDFAISSFKHRVGESMRMHSIQNISELIQRIKVDEVFYEIFLKDIAVIETEAFRDSHIWRIIKSDILKELYEKTRDKIRIWLPGCSSGDELYTFAIVLKESCLTDKAELMASSISARCIEHIKTGLFNSKKIEINLANYERYKGKVTFTDYYTSSVYKTQWDTSLIKDIKFLKPLSLFKEPPQRVNLIIFRNRMIYYNNALQQKVLDTLYNSLAPDGYLILGTKETILNFPVKHKFILVNETESIYRKK